MKNFKETIGYGQGGIPGVTRSRDSEAHFPNKKRESQKNRQTFGQTMGMTPGGPGGIFRPVTEAYYPDGPTELSQKNPSDDRVKDILRSPIELVKVYVFAAAGAISIRVGRFVGVVDPTVEKRWESKKRKARREEMVKEFEGSNNWSKEIENTIDSTRKILKNPGRINLRTNWLLGPKGKKVLNNSLHVSQNTPVDVTEIQDYEIDFAKKIAAGAENPEQYEDMVDLEIKQLFLKNIKDIGVRAIYTEEVSQLQKQKEETSFSITTVSRGEALLAAIGGASGRSNQSMRGGYEVGLANGMIFLRTGGDFDKIASPADITVDYDVPAAYESAFNIADKEVVDKRGWYSGWLRKMLGYDSEGNVPLYPGRIDIGLIGSNEKSSFPALHVLKQQKRIEQVKSAGKKLEDRLTALKALGADSELKSSSLKDQAVDAILKIPRKNVVMDILARIPTAPKFPPQSEEEKPKLSAESQLMSIRSRPRASIEQVQAETNTKKTKKAKEKIIKINKTENTIDQKEENAINLVRNKAQNLSQDIKQREREIVDTFQDKTVDLIQNISKNEKIMDFLREINSKLEPKDKTPKTIYQVLEELNLHNMDQKKANIILNHKVDIKDSLIKKYGQNKGKKIAQMVERRARSILEKNI